MPAYQLCTVLFDEEYNNSDYNDRVILDTDTIDIVCIIATPYVLELADVCSSNCTLC